MLHNNASMPGDIIMIEDESGSMTVMGNEPVESINDFIKEQKAKNIPDTRISLWKFSNKSTLLLDDVLLDGVAEITDYHPGGMTALNDTVAEAINLKLTKEDHEGVICVIVSDGDENASTEWNSSDLNVLIEKVKKEHGWKFVYMGANQDAKEAGGKIGITNCCNFNQAIPGALRALSRSVSESVSQVRDGTQDDIMLGKCKTEPMPTPTSMPSPPLRPQRPQRAMAEPHSLNVTPPPPILRQ